MREHEVLLEREPTKELLTIEEAKALLVAIRSIKDSGERVEELEKLLHAFSPDADGRKTTGPRSDFFEALGQLYLFEKTLHENRLSV